MAAGWRGVSGVDLRFSLVEAEELEEPSSAWGPAGSVEAAGAGLLGKAGAGIVATVKLFGVPIDAEVLADIMATAGLEQQFGGQGSSDLGLIERRCREFAVFGGSDPGRWSGGPWVTLTEWAGSCGVPVRTARDWAAASKIRARRSGRTWLVVADEIPPTRRRHDG